MADHEFDDAVRSLSTHAAYRRVMAHMAKVSADTDTAAITAREHADVARGRAQGVRLAIALLTPKALPKE